MKDIELNLAALIAKSLFSPFTVAFEELTEEEYEEMLDESYSTKSETYDKFALTLSKHTDNIICKIVVRKLLDTKHYSIPNEIFEMWLESMRKPNTIVFMLGKHNQN